MTRSFENTRKISVLFRFLRVIAILGISGALAFVLVSLKKEPEKKQKVKTPPRVIVITAHPVSQTMTVEAYGTVKPRKLVKIAAEVPGRIDYIHPDFVAGGRIGRNELLLRIDPRSYRLDRQSGSVSIRQAKAEIDILKQDIENLKSDLVLSKANVVLSKKEFDRVSTLTQNRFASKNSLDKAEQQYLQAKIQLQNIENGLALTHTQMEQKKSALAMARVNFEKADLAFEKTRISLAFNGLVLEKLAEQGEYVNPGQIVGSVYQEGSLDVDIRIPLERMKWIAAFFENGQVPDAEVHIANLDGLKPHVWKAKVARIKANVDEKTRTLPMTLEIFNPREAVKDIFDLKPGTFVKCIILGETLDKLFVLPRHLLKPGEILYSVVDGRLKMKKVSVLRKFEDDVYIRSGLEPGEKIVSSPLPGAVEGMTLTIKEDGE